MQFLPYRHVAAVLAIPVLVAGCDKLNGVARSTPLSLTVAARALNTGAAVMDANVITAGGHSLDLQLAQLYVTRIKLEKTDATGDSDSEDLDDDPCGGTVQCEDFVTAPLVIDVPVNGGVITPFTGTVPAGRYSEAEFTLGGVRLKGVYDGQAFDVNIPLNLEAELEFHPPLEVTGSEAPRNFTIAFSLEALLRNPDGTLIDPRRLETDATLRETVRARLRASLESFEDDDRDGEDDDLSS